MSISLLVAGVGDGLFAIGLLLVFSFLLSVVGSKTNTPGFDLSKDVPSCPLGLTQAVCRLFNTIALLVPGITITFLLLAPKKSPNEEDVVGEMAL